jgi:hypothetical protein
MSLHLRKRLCSQISHFRSICIGLYHNPMIAGQAPNANAKVKINGNHMLANTSTTIGETVAPVIGFPKEHKLKYRLFVAFIDIAMVLVVFHNLVDPEGFAPSPASLEAMYAICYTTGPYFLSSWLLILRRIYDIFQFANPATVVQPAIDCNCATFTAYEIVPVLRLDTVIT